MKNILEMIRAANPDRSHMNLERRYMKLVEELGEVSEAYLNVTSPSNLKVKTWDDVREEIADVLIVAVDVALTKIPDEISVENLINDWTIDQEELSAEQPDMEKFFYWFSGINNHSSRFILNLEDIEEARDASHDFVYAAISLARIPLPDQEHCKPEFLHNNLAAEITRKLAIWQVNRQKMTVNIDCT